MRTRHQTAKGMNQPNPALFATFAPLRLEIDSAAAAKPPLAATSTHRYDTRPYHPQRLVFQTAKTQSAQRKQLNLSNSKRRQVTSLRLHTQPRETETVTRVQHHLQNVLFATFAPLRLEIDRATHTMPTLAATSTPHCETRQCHPQRLEHETAKTRRTRRTRRRTQVFQSNPFAVSHGGG
jgi:hypothetical protein